MNSLNAIVDVGGSGIKVSIFDLDGSVDIHESIPTPLIYHGLSVTGDPDGLFNSILLAMNVAASRLGDRARIQKVYISSIRQGFCIIDSKRELTPLIFNNDQTGIHAKSDIAQYGHRRIYEETGHWFAPQLTLPKLVHLRRTQPDLFSLTTKLVFVHDWLVWRLTKLLSTEMTLVSAGQIALIEKRELHEDLLDHFGIDSNFIPQRRTVGDEASRISRDVLVNLSVNWSDCTVYIGGGDSHFLHAGASNNLNYVVVVSAGSSTPITMLKILESRSSKNQPWVSTSFTHDNHLYEGNVGYPGTHFNWLNQHSESQKELGIEGVSEQLVTEAPYVFGACMHWNMNTWSDRPPFSIMNLRGNETVEALKFGLTMDYVFAVEQQIEDLCMGTDFSRTKIVMTGGGGNQLLANLLATISSRDVSIMTASDAVSNSIRVLQSYEFGPRPVVTGASPYSDDVKSALKMRRIKHKELYEQCEKSGRLVPNV